ncbi:MAG: EamA family transporter, partial [Elusimicrobiota bacterium]
IWIPLALGTAFSTGTADALSKQLLKKNSVQIVSMARWGGAALFLFPFLFFVSGPSDQRVFWQAVLTALPLEIIAILSYQTALKLSPLSTSIPYLAFTPVFLIATGWIFLGETPSTIGIVGTCLVTLGAAFLQGGHLKPGEQKWKILLPRTKGAYLMLLVAFIYSITSALAKKATLVSNPYYFSAVYNGVILLALLPLTLISKKPTKQESFKTTWWLFAGLGLLEALTFILQFNAFLYVELAYSISIKRLSLLIAVFYGWFFFKESDVISKMFAAFVMLTGAVLVLFARP